MTDSESKQLLSDIIKKAQEGVHLPFRPIVAWDEFRFVGLQAKSTKLVIRTLKASAKNLFKEYCKDVIAGISEINKLLAYSELCDIIAFYEVELNIIQTMLDDYDKYLGDWGNFLNAILGGRRDL
jgi:hypothetical protein